MAVRYKKLRKLLIDKDIKKGFASCGRSQLGIHNEAVKR